MNTLTVAVILFSFQQYFQQNLEKDYTKVIHVHKSGINQQECLDGSDSHNMSCLIIIAEVYKLFENSVSWLSWVVKSLKHNIIG